MLSSSSFLRSRMPLAVFTNTETGRTILPLSHSGPPSHLRRTIVTTVLISQNDSRQASFGCFAAPPSGERHLRLRVPHWPIFGAVGPLWFALQPPVASLF